MALTSCRECGREVSDQARTCPACGAPTAAAAAAAKSQRESLLIAAFVIVGVVVMVVMLAKSRGF